MLNNGRFVGHVYRGHDPRWAFLPDSGDGAKAFGGRFNPKGMPALYTSLTFQGAWNEAQQGLALKSQPLTLCVYDVDCDNILDLSEPNQVTAQGITPDEFKGAWKCFSPTGSLVDSPTQRLSRKLCESGINGIIVPSFANGCTPGSKNLVFFNWSKTSPNQVIVIDDHQRLPGNQNSWR
jgi:RES domain-containing protein